MSGFHEITFLNDMRGAGSDLDGLLAHDSNRVGFIDAADAIFADLLVWIDRNADGKSDSGERFTLAELGMESLDPEVSNRTALDHGRNETQVIGETISTGVQRNRRVLDVALKVYESSSAREASWVESSSYQSAGRIDAAFGHDAATPMFLIA